MLKHRYAQHVIHWIEHPISACSTCHTLTLDSLLFCHAYVRQKLEVATSVRERAVVLMTTWAKQVPFTFGEELPGCNELCMVWQVPILKQLAYAGTQALNPRPTRCASTWTRHSRRVFSVFPGNSHLSQNETQTHMMFPHDCPPNITKNYEQSIYPIQNCFFCGSNSLVAPFDIVFQLPNLPRLSSSSDLGNLELKSLNLTSHGDVKLWGDMTHLLNTGKNTT